MSFLCSSVWSSRLSLRFTASCWLLAIACCAPPATAAVFTYQGVLKTAGSPLNGTVDLRFRLYGGAAGGIALGSLPVNAVTLTDGLITTQLDFGPNAFNGNDRWLEIDVASPANGGAGPFTTLTPRQRIGYAPMAQYALNATLSGTYANPVSFSNAANAFTGSGAGLTNLNASNIGTGNLNVARLPDSGLWAITSPLRIDNSTFAIDPAADRVGIGTILPQYTLHVIGDMSVDGSTFTINDDLNRVGIGTSSPTNTLHVAGATRLQGPTTIDGTAVFNQPIIVGSSLSFAHVERYIAYGPYDFRPTSGSTDFIATTVHYCLDSGTLYACRVPVHVPHGARLIRAQVWFKDQSSTQNFTVSSRRKPLNSSSETVIDDVSSVGSLPTVQAVVVDFENIIVDNTTENYSIEIRYTVPFNVTDMEFYGARLIYEVATYLP